MLTLLAAGCGGAAPARPTAARPTAEEERPPSPPVTEGTIARAELEAVLDQGLGRFLQVVGTEPHLEAGRFVGHRLTELRGRLFERVDLAPGDTLLRVNGMAIERPEQAMAAWNALRVASELTIDYQRDGESRQLRFAIDD